MDTSNPKQAIVDKIKKSTNILVTVSHDPTVDALAAALGFTLMLNKLDKHATAVFSGSIPPAITFLHPEKTFEGTVDSLRDFIIALDKEKADRLRYKVEGDVVRIYITPYRTNISEKDLQYSQGDFNVDMVIALGVERQSDLDEAISVHGRILHDAAVATITTTSVKSSIGTVDWSDDKASCLCEMLMSLSEALQPNLLDEQIATALLTGIVASTDRFSNVVTTPKVMTMAAQLMAAGANQQLISEKLQEGQSVPLRVNANGISQSGAPTAEPPRQGNGEFQVQHEDDARVLEQATRDAEVLAVQAEEQRQEEANEKLEAALGHVNAADTLQHELEEATAAQAAREAHDSLPPEEAPAVPDAEPHEELSPPSADWRGEIHDAHGEINPGSQLLMGGTLNATATQAEEAARAETLSGRNHTILSHDSPEPVAQPEQPLPKETQADDQGIPELPQLPQLPPSQDQNAVRGKTLQPVTMSPIASPSGLSFEETPLHDSESPAMSNPSIADLEAQVQAAAAASPITSSIDDARAAVNDAFGTQPLSVGGQVTPIPPSEDFMPAAPPPPVFDASSIVPPPSMPPLPDFSTLPPLPPQSGDSPNSPHPAVMPPQFPPVDAPQSPPVPGQFQIPGQ